MSNNKATIRASLEGVEGVVAGAAKIKGALAGAGAGASGLEKGVRAAGAAVVNMAASAIRASGILREISLEKGVAGARQMEGIVARLGQASGSGGAGRLAAQFDGLEKSTLTAAPALAQYASSLTRATYDANSSADALRGLSTEALATGRDLSEGLNLGAALHNSLGVVGDTTMELGRLRDMASQVGLAGGRLQLQDSLAALSPLLATVNTKSDESRAKLEALVAVMGKGLKPEAATQVAAGALSMIKSRALDIERATGQRVLDDNGEIIDPTQTLANLKRTADKKFGAKNSDAKRRALISEFGSDLGLSVMRTDYSAVGKLAASSTANAGAAAAKTEAEAQAYRDSATGRREAMDLAVDARVRQGGKAVGGLGDRINNRLGADGSIAANVTGQLVNSVVSDALGGGTTGKLAGGAAGLVVGGAVGLGVASKDAIGALARDTGLVREGDKLTQRALPASLAGLGVTPAATQRAELVGVGTAGSDSAALAAALAEFTATQKGMPKANADATAAAIRGVKLTVQPPVDPNALKGGN